MVTEKRASSAIVRSDPMSPFNVSSAVTSKGMSASKISSRGTFFSAAMNWFAMSVIERISARRAPTTRAETVASSYPDRQRLQRPACRGGRRRRWGLWRRTLRGLSRGGLPTRHSMRSISTWAKPASALLISREQVGRGSRLRLQRLVLPDGGLEVFGRGRRLRKRGGDARVLGAERVEAGLIGLDLLAQVIHVEQLHARVQQA